MRTVIYCLLLLIVSSCSTENELTKIQKMRKIFPTEEFGPIEVYAPKDHEKVAMVIIPRDSARNNAVVEQLVDENALVFVINSGNYLDSIFKNTEPCVVIGGSLERLNQSLQSSLKVKEFNRALLVGVEQGALLSAVAYFQSPGRFAGALAYDAELSSNRRFCDTDEMKSEQQGDLFKLKITQHKDPASPLVLRTRDEAHTADLKNDLETLLNDGKFKSDDRDFIELFSSTNAPLVLFFSGDGGWADIDEELGNYLNDRGLNVVGVNSLLYFWKHRTPEETAAMAAALIDKATKTWGQPSKIYLAGYSLGGEVVPVVYNRLPESIRAMISSIVMLVPETKTDLEVQITDWLGIELSESPIDLLPEIEKIPHAKLVCIYGEEETEEKDLCDKLDRNKYRVISLPGGHHFDGAYEKLGETIFRELK